MRSLRTGWTILLLAISPGCASSAWIPASKAQELLSPGSVLLVPPGEGGEGSVTGLASALPPEAVLVEAPEIRQERSSDCGLACLESLLAYHGRSLDDDGRERFSRKRAGSNGFAAGEIRDYLRRRGFRAALVHGSLDDRRPAGLLYLLERGYPVIARLVERRPPVEARHYMLVVGFEPAKEWLFIMDPAQGVGAIPYEAFDEAWARSERLMLVAAPEGG